MRKKYIRKATRVSNHSLSVVIPADIVDELKIRERQKLVIERKGKNIVIRDWKKSDGRE
jgi:antitoxin component of MazEF toxin-antitoxin module